LYILQKSENKWLIAGCKLNRFGQITLRAVAFTRSDQTHIDHGLRIECAVVYRGYGTVPATGTNGKIYLATSAENNLIIWRTVKVYRRFKNVLFYSFLSGCVLRITRR
jgi:hypothetical protein